MNSSFRHRSSIFTFIIAIFCLQATVLGQTKEVVDYNWHSIVVSKSYNTVYKKMYRWMAPLHYSENQKSQASSGGKESKHKISRKREEEMASQAGKLQFRIVPATDYHTKIDVKHRQGEFKPMSKLELAAFIKDLEIWLLQEE